MACLVWSEEMLSSSIDDPVSIKIAIKKAMKTKCSYCKQVGASIKCSEEGYSCRYY